MSARARASTPRVSAFDVQPGRVIAGKYVVERKLGSGWEGEVYKVVERRTGVIRAAKFFYPQRNVRDRAVRLHAKKLDALRHCPIVIQYIHSEVYRWRRIPVTCLLSEYVEGEVFDEFLAHQPRKRLTPFEALHLVHALCLGLEQIHAAGLYHGDLHPGNVMVRRQGITFDPKVVDFFHYGPTTAAHRKDDVVDLARLLYDAVGGRKAYPGQPAAIKSITKGLRRDLILRSFPSAARLRRHIETLTWE